MLTLYYSTQFKKDFKKVIKRPIADVILVGHVITQLQHQIILDKKHVDHALSGDYLGYRDCHIKPDLVLVYKQETSKLKLARLGSHNEIFK